jgi:hypothetical protein
VAGQAWTFDAELWVSQSVGSWVFLTLPDEVSDDVRLLSGPPTGFGSVRVEVSVGDQTWRTSVFPERSGSYVLPVKAAVRRAEGLEPGDRVKVTLGLVTDE